MTKKRRTGYRIRLAYRRARLFLTIIGAIVGASAVANSADILDLAAVAHDASFILRSLAMLAVCAFIPWFVTETLWRWHRRLRFQDWQ
jgi:hypothetical protein